MFDYFKLYAKFRPTNQNFVWLINYVGRFLDLWLFSLIIHTEFCSTLSNYIRNVPRIMFGEWTGASREETYGQSWEEWISRYFYNLYSIITGVGVLFRSNMADNKRGRGAQDSVGEHSRGDEEGDSWLTNYTRGFWGLLASFRHLEKSNENITHLIALQGTKTGNKTVTNLHIWRWKTIVLHALHVHFSYWAFRRRTRSFHVVKWPVLQLRGWNEHMMTNFQICFLTFEALVPI